MSASVKTFIASLGVLVLIGVIGWFGWRAYSWPSIALSNGWKMHISHAWNQVDVTEVPELSRPLLFVQASKNDLVNKMTVVRHAHPATDLGHFVTEMTTQFVIEQKTAEVLGQGYLRPTTEELPYVLLKGNGRILLAMMATKDAQTYYFEARYAETMAENFGSAALASMRSLR